MRVVRFYICSPPPSSSSSSSSSSSPPSSPPFFSPSSSPDFNMELQIAVGSAGPQQRAPDYSGQRRTSTASLRLQWAAPELTRGLWSGLGNAGPHPGGSGADWATPDLTRGLPERSGQRRTSAARRYVRRCVRNMSEKTVKRYCNRNVG